MDYSQDILARLQAGEKVEDIAAELTESINAANEKYKAAEERAKAEAAAAAKSKNESKKIAVEELFDAICDILEIWGVAPDLVDQIENVSGEEIEDLVKTFDSTIPLLAHYMEVQKGFQEVLSNKKEEKKEVDPIESFLNKFVR